MRPSVRSSYSHSRRTQRNNPVLPLQLRINLGISFLKSFFFCVNSSVSIPWCSRDCRTISHHLPPLFKELSWMFSCACSIFFPFPLIPFYSLFSTITPILYSFFRRASISSSAIQILLTHHFPIRDLPFTPSFMCVFDMWSTNYYVRISDSAFAVFLVVFDFFSSCYPTLTCPATPPFNLVGLLARLLYNTY